MYKDLSCPLLCSTKSHYIKNPVKYLMQEPIYDERLTWEGRSDKMVQVFIKKYKLQPWNMTHIQILSAWRFSKTSLSIGVNSFQSYKMCSLGYDYHILDNAFLIHRCTIVQQVLASPYRTFV